MASSRKRWDSSSAGSRAVEVGVVEVAYVRVRKVMDGRWELSTVRDVERRGAVESARRVVRTVLRSETLAMREVDANMMTGPLVKAMARYRVR